MFSPHNLTFQCLLQCFRAIHSTCIRIILHFAFFINRTSYPLINDQICETFAIRIYVYKSISPDYCLFHHNIFIIALLRDYYHYLDYDYLPV